MILLMPFISFSSDLRFLETFAQCCHCLAKKNVNFGMLSAFPSTLKSVTIRNTTHCYSSHDNYTLVGLNNQSTIEDISL